MSSDLPVLVELPGIEPEVKSSPPGADLRKRCVAVETVDPSRPAKTQHHVDVVHKGPQRFVRPDCAVVR